MNSFEYVVHFHFSRPSTRLHATQEEPRSSDRHVPVLFPPQRHRHSVESHQRREVSAQLGGISVDSRFRCRGVFREGSFEEVRGAIDTRARRAGYRIHTSRRTGKFNINNYLCLSSLSMDVLALLLVLRN